jgi:hypothetical protein
MDTLWRALVYNTNLQTVADQPWWCGGGAGPCNMHPPVKNTVEQWAREVVHAYSPSTGEREAGGLSLMTTWATR